MTTEDEEDEDEGVNFTSYIVIVVEILCIL